MLNFLNHSISPLKPGNNFYYRLALPHFIHLNSLSSDSSSPNFSNLSNLLQGHISQSHLLQIHAHIFRAGAHQDNLIATRLIGHYPSQLSVRVFHQLQTPNIFPFNAIIRVLAEDGLYSYAFLTYKALSSRSLSPNDLTFSFLLKACFRTNDANYVKQLHTHIVKLGFAENSFICNSLLVVYGKGLKDLLSARKVFDGMPVKAVVCCWTSLIAGFAQSGQSEEALQLFLSMVKGNLKPDDDTMVSILSACSNLEIVDIEKWIRILSELTNNLDSKTFGHDSINTVLVYLFGKWGNIDSGRERFDKITDEGKRSVLAWNAMIGSYVQNGCSVEALNLFRLMMEGSGSAPNHVTMVSVLSACAQIGDLDLGIRVHEYLKSKQRKILALNRNLATALIDMYSKSGSLDRAREVFDRMTTKDVISFNVMIMGLAINGEGEEGLHLFSKMLGSGLNPNEGTFLGVLCACSHSGLLEKGRQMFVEMMQHFSIHRKLEHYACYIDLLSRVGCVEEALEVVSSMPFEPNSFVWGALLSGCLLHNRSGLARYISTMLVESDPENSAGYVLLSNVFAVDRRWGDVSGMRRFMRIKGVKKQAGCSWISIDGIVHEFLVGFPSHPQIGSIYDTLDILLKEMKFVSSFD